MDRKLFLVSKFTDEFAKFTVSFIEAAGGRKAKIAFLMQDDKDWEEHFAFYREIFRKSAPIKLFPVFPDEENEFKPEMVKKLKKATGIFVDDGFTFRFIMAYTRSEITPIIKEKYYSGIPYAGLAAGAIITIRLGFLPKMAFEPHFNQRNRFYELQKKLCNSKADYGLGLDDGIWLEIENETRTIVCGKGSCYICNKIENGEFEFKIFHPGDEFKLKTE